jgi:hypothetical protein
MKTRNVRKDQNIPITLKKPKRLHVLAALLVALVGAGSVVMFAHGGARPTHAATTYHGLCRYQVSGNEICVDVRTPIYTGETVYTHDRNILGDTGQQWGRRYRGSVCAGQASCGGSYWPFRNHGFDQLYYGDGVFSFYAGICLSDTNALRLTMQPCSNSWYSSGQMWVWTPTGALVSPYWTDFYGAPWLIKNNNVNDPLFDDYINGCEAICQWHWRAVSG